jgi:hypothetical protein
VPPLYKLLSKVLSITCEIWVFRNAPPYVQHSWVWCVDINGGWPDRDRLWYHVEIGVSVIFTKPACKMRSVSLYKLLSRVISIWCDTWIFLNTPPHAQQSWVWCVDINCGWPNRDRLWHHVEIAVQIIFTKSYQESYLSDVKLEFSPIHPSHPTLLSLVRVY